MQISMGERGSGLKSWVVGGFGIALLHGCVGDTPPSDVPAPDLTKISVFYPVDGLVRGRGLAGAVTDPAVTHVRVASHPTKGETIVPVDADGGFEFQVIGISDDLLEISGALDDAGKERGDPVYIVVPPTPLPPPTYVCCGATETRKGTCQTEEAAEAEMACPDPATGITQCYDNRDCGVESGELLPLDTDRIQISPPDADGRISVAGTVQPTSLVTLENRGKEAVGGYIPTQRRLIRISDEAGNFTFDSVQARGDDELIIQVRDLLGFRTPEASILVPDAPVAGVDVIGAFAWAPLTPNQTGPVAVLVAPYGVDGRTICPDSTEDPVLCLSGGLTYDMLNLGNVMIDSFSVTPSPTPLGPQVEHNRGLVGGNDPLAGAQDVVVVLDMSAEAAKTDTEIPPRRFNLVRDFVSGLRSRDHVGLVTFGTDGVVTRVDVDQTDDLAAQRQLVMNALTQLAAVEPAGPSTVFEGITHAAADLTDAKTRRPGRIVVVTLSDEEGDPMEATDRFDATFDMVRPNPSLGFDGYVVDIVAVDVAAVGGNLTLLGDIAGFTGGEFYNVPSINSLNQTLADLRTLLSGSFVLLYDMLIPEDVGKQGTISFTAGVTLPGSETVQASYSGPLRITNAQ